MARPLAGRRAAAAALPRWIRPQLTQLVDAGPEGDQWVHEIKYDGYRMHARLDRGVAKLLTRTGLDWTHKYPGIAKAVAALNARQAYLDGELCGVGPDGITSFNIVQRHRTAARRRRSSSSCSIFCTSTAKTYGRGR
jgi:ATP-dependent DNA ligase